MNSKQNTVLWIGLIIIALNLVTQWSTVKGIVFNKSASTTSTGTKQPTQLV